METELIFLQLLHIFIPLQLAVKERFEASNSLFRGQSLSRYTK